MRLRPLLALAVLPLAACAQDPTGSPKGQPVPPSAAATPAPEGSKPAEEPKSPAAPVRVSYSQCNVDGPYIAMTFDDGPHATQTPRLLDMLKERKLKATFFCLGQCVAEYPDIAKRIVEEGHEIASHSWSHPNLIPMSEASVRDQLERTHQVIKQITGVEVKNFRPPYGNFTMRQRNWAFANFGYRTILWDVDTLDWQHRNPARTESVALSQTRNGSIILQHDIHKTTIDAMPGTLDGLAAKGFKFVTVAELLAMDRPVPPKPKATPGTGHPKATPGAKPTATR